MPKKINYEFTLFSGNVHFQRNRHQQDLTHLHHHGAAQDVVAQEAESAQGNRSIDQRRNIVKGLAQDLPADIRAKKRIGMKGIGVIKTQPSIFFTRLWKNQFRNQNKKNKKKN